MSKRPDNDLFMRSTGIGYTLEGYTKYTNVCYEYRMGHLSTTYYSPSYQKRIMYLLVEDVIELNNPNHTPDGVLIVKTREMV